jgi:hypothetical protein
MTVPYVKVTNSLAQSIPNNTPTVMDLDTVVSDPLGMFDNTNNCIVFPTSGVYTITVGTAWAADATFSRRIDIRVSATGAAGPYSSLFINQFAGAASVPVLSFTVPDTMDGGYAVRAEIYQNTGVALSTVSGANNTYIEACLTGRYWV